MNRKSATDTIGTKRESPRIRGGTCVDTGRRLYR